MMTQSDFLFPPASPYDFFWKWMGMAKETEPSDPDAACLATVDENGMPDARMVLIRMIDERGFCFFTNRLSAKGQELADNPKAAITFHWKSRKQQVRIRGVIETVSDAESDAYYSSRPLGNRIGAWASLQSQTLPSRDILVQRVEEQTKKWGDAPPRPPHWGGYRLIPTQIEFWEEGEARLHHRLRYTYNNKVWKRETLYP